MSPLTETVLFVFGLVAVGYLSGWSGYLRPEAGEALSQFAANVAVPMLLFRTMANADFHGAAPWRLWTAYFAAVVVAWTAGNLVATRLFGRDRALGVVAGVGSSFSNTVLVGIPLMIGVYGQPGVDILSLIVSVHLPSLMAASIVLFEMFGRSGEPVPARVLLVEFVRRMLTNPLIVAILAGLAWRLAGLPLPALPMRLVDALAGIAGPLALFAVGLALRRFGVTGNVRLALVMSAIKLGLMPAAAVCLAWALDLPPLPAQVAVATAALPAGINTYLIAVQFNTGQALASNQMTISTGLAVFTSAFWLLVAHAVFG